MTNWLVALYFVIGLPAMVWLMWRIDSDLALSAKFTLLNLLQAMILTIAWGPIFFVIGIIEIIERLDEIVLWKSE